MNRTIIPQQRHIKAIETAYKGHKFRSRLEARWAVFFDALGLEWEYEPEGFDLPDGSRYLPDFRVVAPQGTVSWYEVKQKGHTNCEKMASFAIAMEGAKEHMRVSDDWRAIDACDIWTVYQTLSGDPYNILVEGSDLHACPKCATITKASYGHRVDAYGLYHGCGPCDVLKDASHSAIVPSEDIKGDQWVSPQIYGAYLARIKAAATAARSARFEHGQSGATL